jgi:hypothetical protein
MTQAEACLAALCAAAGYPAELRAVIAEATFPTTGPTRSWRLRSCASLPRR